MAGPIHDKIKQSLKTADSLYHRLVLLVGVTDSGKTKILHDVADDFGVEIININLALSTELLGLTAKQRALHLQEILNQIVDGDQTLIVLDNLEILFDKTLKQDPLRVLQSMSRNRPVLASWSGTFSEGKLLYAEADHPEYRSYDSIDALIVDMNGYATIDTAKK
ncbi:MAG: BREX-3 system P-loop-containing protein BrxF [Methylomicrobium sp.]